MNLPNLYRDERAAVVPEYLLRYIRERAIGGLSIERATERTDFWRVGIDGYERFGETLTEALDALAWCLRIEYYANEDARKLAEWIAFVEKVTS